MADTVRFSELVKAAGKPEVYLPLADPKHDREFMRAVREQRVLSLKQEPTGTKKDFGTIGFLAEKHVSYLVFPKTLTAFDGRRVVGIKYDLLQEAEVAVPRSVPAAPKRSVKPAVPKPKPKPRPKRFTAVVRITSANEVKVTVKALDEKQARGKAEEEARKRIRAPAALVQTELIAMKEG